MGRQRPLRDRRQEPGDGRATRGSQGRSWAKGFPGAAHLQAQQVALAGGGGVHPLDADDLLGQSAGKRRRAPSLRGSRSRHTLSDVLVGAVRIVGDAGGTPGAALRPETLRAM